MTLKDCIGRAKYVVIVIALTVCTVAPSYGETKNERSFGLLLGDPVALSYRQPVTETTFIDIKAGIWTWHFWEEPIVYDVPFLSADYDYLFTFDAFPYNLYVGAGLALYIDDNPKDDDDSDVVAAFRMPIGMQLYKRDNLTVNLEIAPVHQFAPWYVAEPYGIELHGGLLLRYAY